MLSVNPVTLYKSHHLGNQKWHGIFDQHHRVLPCPHACKLSQSSVQIKITLLCRLLPPGMLPRSGLIAGYHGLSLSGKGVGILLILICRTTGLSLGPVEVCQGCLKLTNTDSSARLCNSSVSNSITINATLQSDGQLRVRIVEWRVVSELANLLPTSYHETQLQTSDGLNWRESFLLSPLLITAFQHLRPLKGSPFPLIWLSGDKTYRTFLNNLFGWLSNALRNVLKTLLIDPSIRNHRESVQKF